MGSVVAFIINRMKFQCRSIEDIPVLQGELCVWDVLKQAKKHVFGLRLASKTFLDVRPQSFWAEGICGLELSNLTVFYPVDVPRLSSQHQRNSLNLRNCCQAAPSLHLPSLSSSTREVELQAQ